MLFALEGCSPTLLAASSYVSLVLLNTTASAASTTSRRCRSSSLAYDTVCLPRSLKTGCVCGGCSDARSLKTGCGGCSDARSLTAAPPPAVPPPPAVSAAV